VRWSVGPAILAVIGVLLARLAAHLGHLEWLALAPDGRPQLLDVFLLIPKLLQQQPSYSGPRVPGSHPEGFVQVLLQLLLGLLRLLNPRVQRLQFTATEMLPQAAILIVQCSAVHY
jgi:hypothetical protein